jgi:hypothetical protein
MIELFTNNLHSPIIESEMKEAEAIQTVGTDEMLFYNTIRADLQEIQVRPRAEVVERILQYSKNYAG